MSDEQDNGGYAADDRDIRRAQMLDLLSAWSEDNWAAGWMSGIEKEARRAGGLWTVMAAACGGWPKGYRAEEGWEPLTTEEKGAALAMVAWPHNASSSETT